MKKIFCGMLFLFSATFVSAQNTALNSLDKLLSHWKTLSTDFVQTVSVAGQGETTYKGKLYLSKPNRFRWIINQPEPQIVVADGKNLWIYDQELAQVTVQALSEQLSETPALFLSGESTEIAQAFEVKQLTANPPSFLVKPKKEDTLLQQMVLSFNKENQLTKMQIKDALGQTTILNFSNIKINPRLDKNLFTFTPPQNVDLVGSPL